MKKIALLLTIPALLFSYSAVAQNVGINETGNPADASAGLDVDFDDKGFLLPRVALTNTTNQAPIGAPANSLMVYNTATAGDVTPGYYYWNGTIWKRFAESGDAWRIDGNAGTNAGTNFLGTTDNNALRIRTNNNPRFEFANNTASIRGVVNGSATLPTYSWTANTNMGMYRVGTNILGFSTSGVLRMRIQPNGNVGINAIPNANNNTITSFQTTTTGTAGWFNTTANTNWVTLEASATSTTQGTGVSGTAFVGINGSVTDPAGWSGFFDYDTYVESLYHNGTFFVSDSSMKSNIVPLNSSLSQLKQLQPVSYLKKNNYFTNNAKTQGEKYTPDVTERLEFGFIAQEIELIFPHLVKGKVFKTVNGEDKFLKGVDYTGLIPVLTKAIQEQQEQIETLEQRIEALENALSE